MTISSEIDRIKTNITNAYTAAEAKGATMPEARNSANLASTISTVSTTHNEDMNITENGIYMASDTYTGLGTVDVEVLNPGDVINAVNYTFKNIQKGEKVFIKRNTQIEQEYFSLPDYGPLYGNPTLIDRQGHFIYTSNGQYNIEMGTLNTNIRIDYSFHPRYDSHGNIFLSNYRLYSGGCINTNNLCYIENDYAIEEYESGKFYLRKINKSDFSTLQFWSFTKSSLSMYYTRFAVIGNILCASTSAYNSKQLYYGIIDENSNEINLQQFTNNSQLSDKLNFIGSTKDNKYLLVRTLSSNTTSYQSTSYGIQLYKIDSNYNLLPIESENADFLQYKTDNHGFVINYNRDTNILTIDARTYNRNKYAIFKYENNDFTTVSLELNEKPTDGSGLSLTDDFTLACWGNIYYKLRSVPYGVYELIPYSYGMGKDIIFGRAAENILQNDSGEVYVGTVITPDLESKIIRQNGQYYPITGFNGFSEVDVGIGQIGETYEAENTTNNTYQVNDKVWLNYRQMLIENSSLNNKIDGHSAVHNSIGFICDATTSTLYYNSFDSNNSFGVKYNLINNTQTQVAQMNINAYQGANFTYLEKNIPCSIRKTGTYNDNYMTTKVTDEGLVYLTNKQIGYGFYLYGSGNDNLALYFPDGTRSIVTSDAKVWKHDDKYYLGAYVNYRARVYSIDMENKSVTELSVNGSGSNWYFDTIGFTSDEKYIIRFTIGHTSNYSTFILKLDYSNNSCTLSLVNDTKLPETAKSMLNSYCCSWFNPQNDTLIIAPLNITNINQIIICKYNKNTDIFEDITAEVSLPNSPITLYSYNSGTAQFSMWLSTDYKTLIFADVTGSKSYNWLNVYYMDNAEGWVITNYNNINQDSITGFASEVITPGTIGNVIVGIPIGSDSGAYSSKLTLQGVVDGLPQPTEEEVIEDTLEILNNI